jgi:hypothetical protein
LFLVQVQPPGNNVAAEIIQENRQVHPLVPAGQHKAGDVTLPEISRPGPFEPTGRLDLATSIRPAGTVQALFQQGIAHASRAHPDPLVTEKEIPHFSQTKVGKPAFDRGDLLTDPWLASPPSLGPLVEMKTLGAFCVVAGQPCGKGVLSNTPKPGKILDRHIGLFKGFYSFFTLHQGVGAAVTRWRRWGCGLRGWGGYGVFLRLLVHV